MRKLLELIVHPWTPIIAVCLYGLLEKVLFASSAYLLAAIIGLVLGIVALIALVKCYKNYESRILKWVCCFLTGVLLLTSGIGIAREMRDSTDSVPDPKPYPNYTTRPKVTAAPIVTCSVCKGSGERECGYCSAGECRNCGGMGYRMYYGRDGYEYRDCSYCGGNGSCPRNCDYGFIPCSSCNGRGYFSR